jgi:hypothetical protein
VIEKRQAANWLEFVEHGDWSHWTPLIQIGNDVDWGLHQPLRLVKRGLIPVLALRYCGRFPIHLLLSSSPFLLVLYGPHLPLQDNQTWVDRSKLTRRAARPESEFADIIRRHTIGVTATRPKSG